MMAPCTIFNVTCATVTLAIAFAFAVDSLAREVTRLIKIARLWAFVTLLLFTAQLALEGDPSKTVLVTTMYLLYGSTSLVSALYFCEVFHDVFFHLRNQQSDDSRSSSQSGLLQQIMATYPVLRFLLIATAVIESIAIALHTFNVTEFINLIVAMVFHAVCMLPTCVVLIRTSLLIQRHRIGMEQSKLSVSKKSSTKQIERHTMLFGVLGIVEVLVTSVFNILQLLELSEAFSDEYHHVCPTPAPNVASQALAFIIALFLIRSPNAKLKPGVSTLVRCAYPSRFSQNTRRTTKGDNKAESEGHFTSTTGDELTNVATSSA